MRIERGLKLERIWTVRNVVVHLLVLLPIIAATSMIVPLMSFTAGVPRWVVFVLAIPVGLATPLAPFMTHRHLFVGQIAGAYIDAGICPACGYGLASALSEPDGCRVCPECGGAWRGAGAMSSSRAH